MTIEHMTTLLGLALSALGSFFAFLKSRQNGRQISEIHLIINSRMSELLEATRSSAMYKERGEKVGAVKVPVERGVDEVK